MGTKTFLNFIITFLTTFGCASAFLSARQSWDGGLWRHLSCPAGRLSLCLHLIPEPDLGTLWGIIFLLHEHIPWRVYVPVGVLDLIKCLTIGRDMPDIWQTVPDS